MPSKLKKKCLVHQNLIASQKVVLLEVCLITLSGFTVISYAQTRSAGNYFDLFTNSPNTIRKCMEISQENLYFDKG